MSWIEEYRNKDCKTWFGKFWQRVLFTNIYKGLLALILIGIALVIFQFSVNGSIIDIIANNIFAIGLFTLVGFALVMIIYAWVINPLIWAWNKWFKKK